MHVILRAYSKRTWRTIRKQASKKEEERLGDPRVLCRACLFIYFCSGLRVRITHVGWAVSSLFFSYTYKQADLRQHQTKKKKKRERQREKQEEEYGRNCR